MSAYYKCFLKLLENWPLDKSKVGRDLGEHLRSHLISLHSPIKTSPTDVQNITRQIISLERISKNIYCNKYKRSFSSTATGLSAQQCNQVLSSEFLHYLNDVDK